MRKTNKDGDVVKYECDICGRSANHYGQWDLYLAGYAAEYHTTSIEISHVGDLCDNSGEYTEYYDICPTCFKSKVLPSLKNIIGKEMNSKHKE